MRWNRKKKKQELDSQIQTEQEYTCILIKRCQIHISGVFKVAQ